MIKKLLSIFRKKPDIMELPKSDTSAIKEILLKKVWVENKIKEAGFRVRDDKRVTTDLFEEIIMEKHYRPIRRD